MGKSFANVYDINEHLPEIYDQSEIETHDIELILELLENMNSPRILEPFCGNGRILIPLLKNGYKVVGMDIAEEMLNDIKRKTEDFDEQIKQNIELIRADVIKEEWPKEFDFVILGCNCMYELATPEDQEKVIEKASNSLRIGGLLLVDHDNMEGPLDENWCNIGEEVKSFPEGQCSHGVKIQGYIKTIWVDREKRLWKAERRIEVEYPDGQKENILWTQQKHPVSYEETKEWLNKYGFRIIEVYSEIKEKKKFTKGSKRATFIARKEL